MLAEGILTLASKNCEKRERCQQQESGNLRSSSGLEGAWTVVALPKGEKACLAGAKADPSRVRIADVSESSVDPLARAVRHRLKRNHGIVSGIPVVLSTEKPRCALVPAGNEGDNPLDYQVNCTMPFRVSHLCISCVVYPVMFWLGMAICNALNLPHT